MTVGDLTKLMTFYKVETMAKLVEAQMQHIEKLQAKIETYRMSRYAEEATGKAREG